MGNVRMAEAPGRLACQRIFRSWLLTAVWVTATGGLFSWAYFRYHHDPRYFYTRQILGQWLCVSRGTAAVLHLSMACIVFPVSRFLHLAFARLSVPKRMPALCTSLLMHAKKFHLMCAMTLIIASVVHTISHVVNAFNFSHHYNYRYPEVNWGAPDQSAVSLIFTSVVGISGIGMLLLLMMMAVTSMDRARAAHYNYFWLSHHLALPLLVLYLVHPLSHVIKEVRNLDTHDPFSCNSSSSTHHHHRENNSTNATGCREPVFQSSPSAAWKWVIFPIVLIALDMMLRALSQLKNTTVSSMAMLPGNAMEIYIASKGMECSPGQYVLVQIPQISSVEWHPFTIVKCPDASDTNFSVIIKARGDWTDAAIEEFYNQSDYYRSKLGSIKPHQPQISVFGPFASPMEQMVKCKNLVCIGAGIGVTPFMSYIKCLLSNNDNFVEVSQLKFLWICPDPNQLLWFSWTISSLHKKFWEGNKIEGFTYKICVTRGLPMESIDSLMQEKYPLVASRISVGRPNLNEFFDDIKSEFIAKEDVKIFGCGSESLMQELDFRTKMISRGNNKFVFIREAYS